jgi:hypothetical protein
MARDDDLEPRRDGIEIQLLDVVQDVDRHPADLERGGKWHRPRPRPFVVVASDGRDRGDVPQGIQNLRPADVAGMNDSLDAGERSESLRPKQPVGIGNEPDYRGSMKLRFRHR